MTTQEIIGLKIKALRETKELSQAVLAEKVGYKDKTAIAKVEAGKVDLPQSKICALANALDTAPAFFFDNIETLTNTISKHLVTDVELSLSSTEKQIVVEYRKADEVTKEMVHRVLHIEEKRDSEKMA